MKKPSNKNDILSQKQYLAEETLKVAQQALGYLNDNLDTASSRDLISIFQSTMKVHRELTNDIVELSTVDESEGEKILAKEYNSKVDELLKKFTN